QNTGAITFSLDSVPENTAATVIGAPTAITIGTPGENAVRTFAGAAGQKVTLSVAANTIPGADLSVRSPSGAFVGSLFVSDATGFRDALTLPDAGTYTILVDPSGRNTGSLTFTLGAVGDNTGQLSLGIPTTVTIATAGENAVRSFTGAADQLVTLTGAANQILGVGP